MVSRPVVIAVVLSAACSSMVTGTVGWLATRSATCIEPSLPSSADQERRKQVQDFFKSTAPPMTGGQQMRPRW